MVPPKVPAPAASHMSIPDYVHLTHRLESEAVFKEKAEISYEKLKWHWKVRGATRFSSKKGKAHDRERAYPHTTQHRRPAGVFKHLSHTR